MEITFRKATKDDVRFIVKMIANDELGSLREEYKEPLPEKYYHAFTNIDKDLNQELIVIEDEGKKIVGTLQLSFIQYLTYQGGIRAQIEGVRIREDIRGKGLGEKLFNWAINRAKERGAHLYPNHIVFRFFDSFFLPLIALKNETITTLRLRSAQEAMVDLFAFLKKKITFVKIPENLNGLGIIFIILLILSSAKKRTEC